MNATIRWGPPVVALALALAACIDRELAAPKAEPEKEEQVRFPVELNRNVDILFVIDDSLSMEKEQSELTNHFHQMIAALESLEDGLPNIHLGVISTDLGAGPHGQGCTAIGKRGLLQSGPRIPGCTPPDGHFISDVELSDGSRERNYSGSLADTFACIAKLGTNGCGFEQPLQAMRLALDGTLSWNDGFLRDDALLAVIFLGDEDDCSASDISLFDEDDASIGPAGSFRCFAHGVTCAGASDPGQPGPRAGCVARSDSPYLYDVAEFVQFLSSLKTVPKSQILVAGLIAETEPVEVVLESSSQGQDKPVLAPTCSLGPDDEVGAAPPIRLQAFLEAFPLHRTERICNEDLSPAVAAIGEFIKNGLNARCIRNPLFDIEPATPGVQPVCVVEEIRLPNTTDEPRSLIPVCDNNDDPQSSSALPCFRIEEDSRCQGTPEMLAVSVYYPNSDVRDPTTVIDGRCIGQ